MYYYVYIILIFLNIFFKMYNEFLFGQIILFKWVDIKSIN